MVTSFPKSSPVYSMRYVLGALAVLSTLCSTASALRACCSVDTSLVSLQTRHEWCLVQRKSCNDVCFGDTRQNVCDAIVLHATCTCSSGVSPDLADYAQSLQSFKCRHWRTECLANAADNFARLRCNAVVCGSNVVPPHSFSANQIVAAVKRNETSGNSTGISTSSSADTHGSGGSSSNKGGNGSGNLTKGAKAGIAVGAIVGGLALVAAALCCFYSARTKNSGVRPGIHTSWYRKENRDHTTASQTEAMEKAGGSWQSKAHPTTGAELFGKEIYQAPDRRSVGSGSAMARAAIPGYSKSSSDRAPDPKSFELSTDVDAARPDQKYQIYHPEVPRPPLSSVLSVSASPFAGAGPVPTHLSSSQPHEDFVLKQSKSTNTTVGPPSNATAGAATGTPMSSRSPDGGAELSRLKAELEQVRRERDRLQMMHSLREREEELKRAIEIEEKG